MGDCERGVRQEELVARSTEVNAERVLGYGEGRVTVWYAWVGLLAESEGVRGGSSPARGDRFSAFSEVGDSPESGHVDVRRGVKGLGDDGVNAERGLLDLLGKGGRGLAPHKELA